MQVIIVLITILFYYTALIKVITAYNVPKAIDDLAYILRGDYNNYSMSDDDIDYAQELKDPNQERN